MNRGMKKWAPYKSLNEQIDFINEMRFEKNRREKPILSPDQEEEINRLLVNYNHEEVLIKYWDDGYIYEAKGQISNIDATNKRIYFDRYSYLEFANIVDIKIIE